MSAYNPRPSESGKRKFPKDMHYTPEKWKEARSPEQIGNMGGEEREPGKREGDKRRVEEDMGEQEG